RRSQVPNGAKAGDTFDVPQPVLRRIMRYHLVDNTRGEPNFWSPEQLRQGELKATVEKADAKGMTVRLDGTALLSTAPDPAAAERGYDAALLGYIAYDAAADRITRFDLVAAGDHWGEGAYTGGARPGRHTFT
ncbi:MAG: hypothetical protein KY450_14435, partial [Actinobacteria bacterium]|nr:hypothetical protein [Actinomycetota bacterium]